MEEITALMDSAKIHGFSERWDDLVYLRSRLKMKDFSEPTLSSCTYYINDLIVWTETNSHLIDESDDIYTWLVAVQDARSMSEYISLVRSIFDSLYQIGING